MRRRTEQSTPVGPTPVAHREMLLRPPDKTRSQKAKDFVWDKENKTCLTRSPVNWIAITVYYLIFLAGIVLIFALSLGVSYLLTQNEHRPQYTLEDSPIGSTPAMNYFPMDKGRPLIWIGPGSDIQKYITNIDKILKEVKDLAPSYDMTSLGNCSDSPYGYPNSPCIFLRINTVLLWKPDPYKKGDNLPNGLPSHVKERINAESDPKIWTSCEGSTAKDKDMLNQSAFDVQGTPGFSPSVYPYKNEDNFVEPIIALRLNKDFIPKKIMLAVTCTYWTKKSDNKTASVDVNIYFE